MIVASPGRVSKARDLCEAQQVAADESCVYNVRWALWRGSSSGILIQEDIGGLSAEHTVEAEIGALLQHYHLTLAVAESATGGLIAARIVDVPGSSAYFKGGVVAYDNGIKESVLRVRSEVLARYGAVSEQTAREMAEGVRQLMRADVAVSDTGIAGPAGGTPTKPVGLFYIGLAFAQGTRVQEYFFSGTRADIRHQAAERALIMLRDYLRGLP